MAGPIYTTDLNLFNDCTSATGWGEFTGMSLGAGPDTDTDLAIHGSTCITQDRAKVGLNSQGYDGNAVTINANEAFFIWTKFFAPNSLDSIANGGQRVVIGTSLAVWDAWSMDGDKTYAYGGWKNYAVDPTFASDFNNGTVTTYNACGNAWNLTAAPQKGNPFNTDIIRYGRGESIFTAGDSGDPATFNGYSLVNDHPTTGRFGLIQAIAGGYLYKGLMSLGTSATAVYMEDANVVLNIDNTTKVKNTFNRIEVNNATTTVKWTAILITALGTVSKGQFEAIDDATIEKTSCTFTDMDSFIYQSKSAILTTTYRRCGLVTQGSATFDSCIFDNPSGTVAMESTPATIGSIDLCTFNSDGTGYAVDLGVVSINASMDWKNNESGYVAGTANGDDGVTPTGNETIYVDVDNGITLTINVATGASVPSVANAGAGTINVVAGSVAIDVNVKDQSGADIQDAWVYIDTTPTTGDTADIVLAQTNSSGNVSTSYSGVETSAMVRVRKYGYKANVGSIGLTADSNTNVVLVSDPQQN